MDKELHASYYAAMSDSVIFSCCYLWRYTELQRQQYVMRFTRYSDGDNAKGIAMDLDRFPASQMRSVVRCVDPSRRDVGRPTGTTTGWWQGFRDVRSWPVIPGVFNNVKHKNIAVKAAGDTTRIQLLRMQRNSWYENPNKIEVVIKKSATVLELYAHAKQLGDDANSGR